jgi:integrase
MRFLGTVSFIKSKDTLFARAAYRDQSGKRKQVWRKVNTTKGAAKAAVIEEIERRLNDQVEKPKEKTFHDLAEYYRKHHAIEARFVEDVKIAGMKSWKIVLIDVGYLDDFFGDKPLREITRADIKRYRLQALEKPVRRKDENGEIYYKKRALSTVHHHLRTLRNMFSVAYDEMWIDRIPSFREFLSSAAEDTREEMPTPPEFELILDACRYDERIHTLAVVLMVADVGARPIECWNLLWSDVDLNEGWAILTSDKGKKRRRDKVWLTPRLSNALRQLPRENEFVFGGIRSIKRSWATACRLAGVKYDLYSLRHYFASQLKDRGYDEMDIMLAMRHTRPRTTQIYVHVSDEKKQQMAARLSQNSYPDISDALN